ncbi:Ig-like domain-containing protein [Zobellia russellii]|uniref:Ig-like domain-containing protein n=1 Tax=Zobellia russellii TaxID=248907 RepID=UPI0037DD07FF
MSILFIFLFFSCSKDTDLLSDYIVADTQDAKLIGHALDDYFVSTTNAPIVLDVLANDGIDNIENVKITNISIPSNGNVTTNEDKTITYTPDTNLDENNEENQSSNEELIEQPEAPVNDVVTNVNDTTPKNSSETVDTFTYTTETKNEDNTTKTQTGTVTVTINKNYGKLKAFPSAYGAGSNASGGRGGSVYHVTNLNDSGSGSFRDAVSKSNRYIVFDVSGTIELKSNLTTSSDNLTIAGHTAPQGGITITGELFLMNRCDNIIMRYIRFKPKYIPEHISAGNNKNTGYDALNLIHITNSIFDHVSIAWGGDEAVSIVGNSDDVTFQNNLVIDSHKGMILGDSNASIDSEMSLLNNVFVNSGYRFPNVCATNAESINNVVHNWDRNLNVFPCRQGSARFNEINNYYQRGNKSKNVLGSSVHGAHWLDLRFEQDAMAYTNGNVINGVLNAGDDNWRMYRMRFDVNSGPHAGLKQWDQAPYDFKADNPFKLLGNPVPLKTAEEALEVGKNSAGCSQRLNADGSISSNYDSIDETFLNYVKTNAVNKHSKADDVLKASYYIEYHQNISSTPLNIRNKNYDTDRDGMPDEWELIAGSDPKKPDHNIDANNNGYTNLEEYINLIDF